MPKGIMSVRSCVDSKNERYEVKRTFVLILAFSCGFQWIALHAQTTAVDPVPSSMTATPTPSGGDAGVSAKPPDSTASPAPSTDMKTGFDPEKINGHWGLGVGTTDNNSVALSLRKWTSPLTSLEYSLGGSLSPATYHTFSGATGTAYNNQWGLILGWRRVLKRPLPHSLLLWNAALAYSTKFSRNSDRTLNGTTGLDRIDNRASTASLFLGPGFEIFMPYWKNISIEGKIGVILSFNWTDTVTYYNHPAQTGLPDDTEVQTQILTLGSRNNSFSLVSGAIHYYF